MSARTRRMEQLWTRMRANYGSRWMLEYGEALENGALAPVAEIWAKALDDVSNDRLAAGLRACLSRESDRPPTLPEFLRLCGANASGSSRASEYYSSPKAPGDTYRDTPSSRCAKLAERLQNQAEDEFMPSVSHLPAEDRKPLVAAYWTSKIGAVMSGKADSVFPADWRDVAGMPKPIPREKGPGHIPSIGDQMAALEFFGESAA